MSSDARVIPGYRIIRELGRGGMAIVYLAEQESLGREVALKVLNPSLAADADFAERFLREARIAGSFRHRSLLPVYDAGRAGEQLYLAMEYLPNGHAGDLRGADPEQIRRCLIDVAAGLAYAHAKGVVHRDIKPENILRREDGSYVLADFGIARSSQATRELTGPQAAIGTPSYMSPEQWRGEAIDGRADLYSLGIVMFELLTGSTPYRGDDGWSIGMQHMSAARPQLPGTLADWQALLDRLLAVDRDARFANAQELIAALGGKPESTPEAAQGSRPGTALEATAVVITGVPARRRTLLFVGVGVLALVAFAFLALRDEATGPPSAAATSVPMPETAAISTKSVAVLPFKVLSANPSDELFADGLSEEILASLAAIPDLRVPGRTSSFAWKDRAGDVREIAHALGVSHVLEGSVRRSGEQLRITANLLAAKDSTTLWTQTFDRSADDVFAIQNEIAIAVTDRLAVQIGTRTLPTLARLPAAKRGIWLETIGAMRIVPTARIPALVQTLRDLEAGSDVGPDLYTRLLKEIGRLARDGVTGFEPALSEQAFYMRKLAARFPGSVELALGQALAMQSRGEASNRAEDHAQALRLFDEVLERAPNNSLAAIQAAFSARTLLRHDAAVTLAERAVSIDPEDAEPLFALGHALGSAGRGDAAIETMRELSRRFPETNANWALSTFLAGNGDLAEAIMIDRDAANSVRDPGYPVAMPLLRLLGFQRSADAIQSERAAGAKLESHAFLHKGQLPTALSAQSGPFAMIEAVTEAVAQQRSELAREYLNSAWGFFRAQRWKSGTKPADLEMRSAITFVAAALVADEANPAPPRSDIAAVAARVAAMPPGGMPYSTAFWALGAEILSGDLDAAFRRLDGMVELNPLHWQYWVVSPSGREMPTAKILRADPRFAAIWQRREALIARERAKLKQLWPDVE